MPKVNLISQWIAKPQMMLIQPPRILHVTFVSSDFAHSNHANQHDNCSNHSWRAAMEGAEQSKETQLSSADRIRQLSEIDQVRNT